MAVHLVLSPGIDLDEFRRLSEQGLGPRHGMAVLAERLDAKVHIPHPERDRPTAFDRIRSRVIGTPETWAMARRLAGELGRDDLVYCQSESVGLPVASILGKRPGDRSSAFSVTISRAGGSRVAARLLRLADRADIVAVCCSTQAEFLRRNLRLDESRILLRLEHVDNRFFAPGPASADKSGPLVVGVGLEQRDYRTLAAACQGLPVEVRISGFSRYAAVLSRSFPDPMPPNMTRRFYPWPELIQLYRDADVVVAPVFPSLYAAGVTTLLEGLCCRRPVVVTRSPGLSDYLQPDDGLSIVEPFDVQGMRRAVAALLDHPDKAAEQAERGYQLASRRYGLDGALDRMAGAFDAIKS